MPTLPLNDLNRLLADLGAYAGNPDSFDFHATRQLSDQVLLAAGWSVEQDPGFEGGVVWRIGVNPRVSVGDNHRPHPLVDAGHAMAQIPDRFGYMIGRCRETADAPLYGIWITALSGPLVRFAEQKGNDQALCICMALVAALIAEASIPQPAPPSEAPSGGLH